MEQERSWMPVPPSPDVPQPAGAYTPAVRAGSLVFVSGQVPKDPATGALVGEDVRSQTRQVMANVERVLRSAGAGLQDIVSVTAYLARIEDWEAFNETYRELLSPPYPTRTTVGAQLHGFLVEISVIAAVR